MKRYIALLSFLALLLVQGCHPDPFLTVSPADLSFGQEGGSQTVKVSANYPWTASANGAGITVSPASGEGDATVTISVASASSTSEMSGSVSFRSEGLSASVSVKQDAKSAIIVGDVARIPFEGGTFRVDIQYNTDYNVEIEKSAQSWITFNGTKAMSSGKLEFTFTENEGAERSGKVTVADKSGKVQPITLTFVQDAEKKVLVVGDVAAVSAEGGTVEVDVRYNVEYDVEVETSAQSWLHYVKTKAITNGKLVFEVDANSKAERSGKVTITDQSGNVDPVTLTFVQEGRPLEEIVKDALMAIYDAMDGPNWAIEKKWDRSKDLNSWQGVEWRYNKLQLSFQGFGLKGEFPDVFEDLTCCVRFWVRAEADVTGTLPPSFGRLVNLEQLVIQNTGMTSLPDIFTGMDKLKSFVINGNHSLFGSLPDLDSPVLERLVASNNNFSGEIPVSWSKYVRIMVVDQNRLTGKVSGFFQDDEDIRAFFRNVNYWQQDGYAFDVSDIDIPGFKCWIDGMVENMDGTYFSFDDVVRKNKYTVYLIWAPWCPFSRSLMPQVVDYYERYRQDGLEIIATSQIGGIDEDGTGHLPDDYDEYKADVINNGYDNWYNFFWTDYSGNHLTTTPNAEVYDQDGHIVFSSFASYGEDKGRNRYDKIASIDLIPFLETLFGPAEPEDPYESTDYSKDGEVMTLQTATVGGGINIVFMGDGYTDRDMGAGGLYETLMDQAMEEFFAIEPYKTFRNRFNVYAVKVVSQNGRIGADYTTALGSRFGTGTYIGGNDEKAYEYALKVPGITDRNNLLVSVLVNTRRQSGTTFMSESTQSSVAYLGSQGNNPVYFGPTLRHEAGGHGFGFLADEYSTHPETAPAEHIAYYNEVYDRYGWFSNVDFTNDSSTIRWNAFLSDERYKDEVGIFEGGALYGKGAWRPSMNSMMREDLEYFNAPSRLAIYKRIMELSGEEYSFGKFLEYDEVNRKSSQAQSSVKPPLKASGWKPGAPPVIVR